MTRTIRQFRTMLLDNQSGATSIEYALIAGGISAVLAGTISTLGTNVTTMWTSVQTALN